MRKCTLHMMGSMSGAPSASPTAVHPSSVSPLALIKATIAATAGAVTWGRVALLTTLTGGSTRCLLSSAWGRSELVGERARERASDGPGVERTEEDVAERCVKDENERGTGDMMIGERECQ